MPLPAISVHGLARSFSGLLLKASLSNFSTSGCEATRDVGAGLGSRMCACLTSRRTCTGSELVRKRRKSSYASVSGRSRIKSKSSRSWSRSTSTLSKRRFKVTLRLSSPLSTAYSQSMSKLLHLEQIGLSPEHCNDGYQLLIYLIVVRDLL